jgi:hypothetical protein
VDEAGRVHLHGIVEGYLFDQQAFRLYLCYEGVPLVIAELAHPIDDRPAGGVTLDREVDLLLSVSDQVLKYVGGTESCRAAVPTARCGHTGAGC